MSDSLQQLISLLPKLNPIALKELHNKLDEGGIILWSRFESYYRSLCVESQANAIIDWTCSACTFINGVSSICEMCGSNKPSNIISPSSVHAISKFVILHFNGYYLL